MSLLVASSATTPGCPGWTGRWASSSPWRSLQSGHSSSGRETSSGRSSASCCPFSAPRVPPPGLCLWRKSGRRRLQTVPRIHSGTCLDPPASQRGNERASPSYLQTTISFKVGGNNPRRKTLTDVYYLLDDQYKVGSGCFWWKTQIFNKWARCGTRRNLRKNKPITRKISGDFGQ